MSYPRWRKRQQSVLERLQKAPRSVTTICGHYPLSVNYLTTTQDPRLDYFYDKNKVGAHVSYETGRCRKCTSGRSSWILSRRQLVHQLTNGGRHFWPDRSCLLLMSGWEGNLLIAEAAQKGLITTDAAAAYEAGVTASFEYLGITELVP